MENDPLVEPVHLGALKLTHRVVMAPMTRMRTKRPGHTPDALIAEYYGQRASDGGLLITEATDISPQAHGYSRVPGVYTPEQIEGWKAITAAIHAKGGMIANQIWHVGRVSHSSLQPGRALPVAPSADAAPGEVLTSEGELVPFQTPRPLELPEIDAIRADFVQAALNARAAGFDAVEIHGANGYLVDQNKHVRATFYGGGAEGYIDYPTLDHAAAA